MAHSGKTITFGTDLLPQEDNIYSLGNEEQRWKIHGEVLPIVTKTYNAELYNSSSGENYYQNFATVEPYDYNAIWTVHYRITITASGHSDYTEICDVSISGRNNTYYAYKIYNSLVTYSIYNHMLLSSSSDGTPHELGYRMASAYGATNIQKVIKVELLEQINCTVILLDSLKLYTSALPTGYTAWRSFNATSNGLQETGDNDTTGRDYSHSGYNINGPDFKLAHYSLFGYDRNQKIQGISLYSDEYSGNATTSISTSRVYNTAGIDYTRGLWYTNSGSIYAKNANVDSSPAEFYYAIDLRYSDNCWTHKTTVSELGIKARRPIFFRGVIGEDGLFYLRPLTVTHSGTSYSRAWTQDIPSTEDNYVYWLIGYPYYNSSYAESGYQVNLITENKLYWYHNNKFQEYLSNAVKADSVPLSGVTEADDLKAIEGLTGTTGLLKKTAANTWILDTNSYSTTTGTVTSVRVQASSPLVSSSSAASSSTLNTTISFANQNANMVLAGPSTGSATAPTFRSLVAADIPDLSWNKITSNKPTTLTGYGITDAASSEHNHTLKIGNKSLSVSTSEQTWEVHDILKTATNIGTNTSWDQYEPGVYYVASNSAFTGDNNPENTNTNNGIQPYRYGQLIVSRAGNGGVAEFYVSHNDSNSANYGIHYRTGWNNIYVAKWSVLLDSHNYTNYTVTKTGTGASGSWGISITGNASGTASNITGILALDNFTKGSANTALMGQGDSSNPSYVSVSPSISITDGTSSDAPKINLTVLGISGTAQELTKASTSVYGATKLYDGVNSSSTEMAATAKAVKTAYDKAVNIIAESNALVYQGSIDGSNSTTNGGAYTEAANCGDVYIASTAGYINGIYVELGDMLICNTDETAQANSSNYTTIRNKWDIIQTSDGTVSTSETSVTEGEIPVFKGTTGRFIMNSEKSFTTTAPSSSSSDLTIPTSKAVWTTVNTAITGLDVTAVGGETGNYVSKISETDGKISATISTTSVSNGWTAGTTAGPTLTTTVNGISSTAVAIPSASSTASGIVTTGEQTFAGIKTFSSTSSSTSTATGAVIVSGGLGVAEQVTATRLAANGSNDSYKLYVNGNSLLNGNTTHNGIVYFANGTTYSINNSAVGYLSDLRVDKVRLDSNQVSFYQTENASDSRYAYIQTVKDTMSFTQENGTANTTPTFTFNGNINPATDGAGSLGNSSYRWSSLYLGTDNTYGSAYQPVYWNNGLPTVSYPVQYSTWSITSGDNTATLTASGVFTASTYVISLVVTSGEEYLNGPITWTSGTDTLTLSTAATSGLVEGYVLTAIGTTSGASSVSSSVTT